MLDRYIVIIFCFSATLPSLSLVRSIGHRTEGFSLFEPAAVLRCGAACVCACLLTLSSPYRIEPMRCIRAIIMVAIFTQADRELTRKTQKKEREDSDFTAAKLRS